MAAAPVPKPVPQPKPVAAAMLPEESLPSMRELPQSVQQGLPQVAFGGYMYSNNPADRLLLIDKVLRHEGEEVAPGLILESCCRAPPSSISGAPATGFLTNTKTGQA
ncbi:general secretion pathway protein GspB [Massilia sp. B-10]|nr:general secretion pathway protein GspB [Massilia sp. B-10]